MAKRFCVSLCEVLKKSIFERCLGLSIVEFIDELKGWCWVRQYDVRSF
jgi:hypothetical protein